jgi:hypothetical protein
MRTSKESNKSNKKQKNKNGRKPVFCLTPIIKKIEMKRGEIRRQ